MYFAKRHYGSVNRLSSEFGPARMYPTDCSNPSDEAERFTFCLFGTNRGWKTMRLRRSADVGDGVFRGVVLRFQHIADGAKLRLSWFVAVLEEFFEHRASELGDGVFLGIEH